MSTCTEHGDASSTDLGARTAWLFDLDGTLVDTAPDLLGALRDTLTAFDFDATGASVDLARMRRFVGAGARVTIERALTAQAVAPGTAPVDAMLAHFLDYYSAHIADYSRPFPGVEATLSVLADRRIAVACVTNKYEALARQLLDALDLGRHFEVVVGGDTLAERKPDPAPLLHACRLLGRPLADALMLGDSTTDVGAARNAGIPVVCVRYGYHGETPPEALGADLLVESLETLL